MAAPPASDAPPPGMTAYCRLFHVARRRDCAATLKSAAALRTRNATHATDEAEEEVEETEEEEEEDPHTAESDEEEDEEEAVAENSENSRICCQATLSPGATGPSKKRGSGESVPRSA